MARRIEHRTTSPRTAAEVYAALVDEGYLRDRLAVLGGRDAELVAFRKTGQSTTYQLKQGVAAEHLPSFARGVLGGDLVITRTETWTAAGLTGTIEGVLNGVPGRLEGTITLTDTASGSDLTLTGQTKVGIPFVGGKVEALIAEQVAVLLDKESGFTTEWLARHA
ncbi:DUF2505 domain-containing protein [Saccharothrix longispora]|uniref:DUF2505 domain-containing protein n=1 Tax=Saccharothrix longispora TaxID=33920 RepID=UPI0028FD5B7F|nr:DUF2505 domain-containing protein [Saccharothrix longispora]MBY8847948.1 DUF2505 domain-containing protein [Saccharothrix sp. MB29]MDU0291409.1 DUF2505 domain-containing protein [Saccharothrix longispora]